jgi:hypothetical protein
MERGFINLNAFCCAGPYFSVPMVVTHNGMALVEYDRKDENVKPKI